MYLQSYIPIDLFYCHRIMPLKISLPTYVAQIIMSYNNLYLKYNNLYSLPKYAAQLMMSTVFQMYGTQMSDN